MPDEQSSGIFLSNTAKEVKAMAKNETYEEFVEKFKPKKTTDDCYTPANVYEVIKNWVVNEYRLENLQIVRPFYPGGDYENYDYPENCVVIDNPPFSIISKISKFYADRKIKFFLFAPHLTLFSGNHNENNVCYICCSADITYENGAVVATDFITNMDKSFIRTAPELLSKIKNEFVQKKHFPKYRYPDNLITSSRIGKIATVPFFFDRSECFFCTVA